MSAIHGFETAALPNARAAAADRTIDEARALDSSGGRTHDRAEIRRTAEAFEGLLLKQLVTRMREAQIEGGLFGEEAGSSVYEGMFDDFLSDHLTKNSPLGIADMLERQWTAELDDLVTPTTGARQAALSAAARFRAARTYGARQEETAGGPAISREFGWGQHPILDRRAHHDGLDFPAANGTPVHTPRPGRVARVDGTDQGYGLQVVVEHPGGIRTRYAHLSATSVRPGQLVRPGVELGRVGETGRATGPHLHFEALVDGRPVDPRQLLGRGIAAQVLGPRADEMGER